MGLWALMADRRWVIADGKGELTAAMQTGAQGRPARQTYHAPPCLHSSSWRRISLARAKTPWNIAGVSLPVLVFCRLGW